jgi:single-strand DNA-binding protein
MYRNHVELIGFIGSDAETKTTPNGKTVTTFSIATKTSYIKDGDRTERTEWHRVQVWGRLGEYAAAFKKGSHICVEGELRSREYESNGAKIRTYDIVASSIINLRAGHLDATPLQKSPPHRRPLYPMLLISEACSCQSRPTAPALQAPRWQARAWS